MNNDEAWVRAYLRAEEAGSKALATYRRDPIIRKLQLAAYAHCVLQYCLWMLAPIGAIHLIADGIDAAATRLGVVLGMMLVIGMGVVRYTSGQRLVPDVAADKAERVRDAAMLAAWRHVRGATFDVHRNDDGHD